MAGAVTGVTGAGLAAGAAGALAAGAAGAAGALAAGVAGAAGALGTGRAVPLLGTEVGVVLSGASTGGSGFVPPAEPVEVCTGADCLTRLRFAVPLCVTGLRVACCALASWVVARPATMTSTDIMTPQRLFIRSIRRSPMARPAACGPSVHCAMAGRRGQSPTRSKTQNRRRSSGKPLRSRGIRPRSGRLPSRCTPAIPARRSGRPWRRCAVRPAARTHARPRRGRAPGPSGTGA